MSDKIQLASIVNSLKPLKDGSMSVTFHTQELAAKDQLLLLQYLGKFGWLLFKEDEQSFEEVDVPQGNSGYEDGKTPSARMRGIIFIYWTKYQKEAHPDFETFYRLAIEKIINQYKDKID